MTRGYMRMHERGRSVYVCAVVAVVPVILIIFLKESPYSAPEKSSVRDILSRNLKHPFVRWGIVFAFMLNIDGGLLELTLEIYVRSDLGVSSLGQIVGQLFLVSLLGVVLGVIGYKFIDKVQKNRLLAIIALIYVGPLIATGVLISTGLLTYEIFLVLFGIIAFVSGLSFVTYTAFFFDLSDPKAAGTMIAIFLGVTNGGMVLGVALGGFIPMAAIYFIAY